MITRAQILDSLWLAASAASVVVLLLVDNVLLWWIGSVIVFADIARVIYRRLDRQESRR